MRLSHTRSACADREALHCRLNSRKNHPRKTILVHDEAQSTKAFTKRAEEKTDWTVLIPGSQTTLSLTGCIEPLTMGGRREFHRKDDAK